VHDNDGPRMATLGGPISWRRSRTCGWRSSSWSPRETRWSGFTCSATHAGEVRGDAATGRRFENVEEVYFFSFAEGRIEEAWGLEDTVDRMRQLGLEA
jgi:hypothetical protein